MISSSQKHNYLNLLAICWRGESNGKLPLRTCPRCSISEPYQSPDLALVPAKPAQGLNTHYYYFNMMEVASNYMFYNFDVEISSMLTVYVSNDE